jgi:hypothetical protein
MNGQSAAVSSGCADQQVAISESAAFAERMRRLRVVLMHEFSADESRAGCVAPSIDGSGELLTGIDLIVLRAVSSTELV